MGRIYYFVSPVHNWTTLQGRRNMKVREIDINISKKGGGGGETSCFLNDLRLAISPGSYRACFIVSATYPALPCQKSFIEAITGREAPSSMMAEVQARFQFWSHPSSPPGSVLPWPALLPFGPRPSWVRGPSFLLPLPGPSNPFSSCGRQGQGGEVVWTEEGGGFWFELLSQVYHPLPGTPLSLGGLV